MASSGVKTAFLQNSPMKGVHGYFSEKAKITPLTPLMSVKNIYAANTTRRSSHQPRLVVPSRPSSASYSPATCGLTHRKGDPQGQRHFRARPATQVVSEIAYFLAPMPIASSSLLRVAIFVYRTGVHLAGRKLFDNQAAACRELSIWCAFRRAKYQRKPSPPGTPSASL